MAAKDNGNSKTLTPTQRRLMNVLGDGLMHSLKELAMYLNDELANPETVRVHIVHLRKKLPTGYGIICEYHRGNRYYRLVRFVTLPPEDEPAVSS